MTIVRFDRSWWPSLTEEQRRYMKALDNRIAVAKAEATREDVRQRLLRREWKRRHDRLLWTAIALFTGAAVIADVAHRQLPLSVLGPSVVFGTLIALWGRALWRTLRELWRTL